MDTPTLPELANRIEDEMRRLHLWNESLSVRSLPTSAFGGNDLSFEEWLQAVLLPRLRDTQLDRLRQTSNLAIAGIRNLDGLEGTDKLIERLGAVDSLVSSHAE